MPSIVSTESSPVPSGPPDRERSWQQAMQDALRRPDELLRLVGLESLPSDADSSFPIFVPREFAARMIRGDRHDPLLRQVLPVREERMASVGFVSDPVGDERTRQQGGILQKYHGRALWVLTGVCPVHCRYCFRQNFDYQPATAMAEEASFGQIECAWLESHSDIEEIILSGGDPLSLGDDKLTRLIARLDAIGHLLRLRIHTRMPVMIPQRVTPALIAALRQSRLTAMVVVHINHVQEIDATVHGALEQFVDAGIPVLNQAVLLAGVNDSADELVALSQRLIAIRVMPYYLHQLDRVHGAAHFEVRVERGIAIVEEMRRRLPGYAVPKYVREIAGAASKLPIG